MNKNNLRRRGSAMAAALPWCLAIVFATAPFAVGCPCPDYVCKMFRYNCRPLPSWCNGRVAHGAGFCGCCLQCIKQISNMGKGAIQLANTFTIDYILENTTSASNPIIGDWRRGFPNVVTLSQVSSSSTKPALLQKYRKTNAVCAICEKPGNQMDVCPEPVPRTERYALCGKTGPDVSLPCECHLIVCSVGGRTLPALGTAGADITNLQPPPSPQASRLGQARNHSRTPSGNHAYNHKKQQESINAAA
ncbi:hypothetical protein HPB51_007829 [Rhipicephalus microplus]|uniref:Uncharacterized protein n=1 Tax=Rhipicephalus microplus TaxID=6941 RepID=A0A9J6EMH9_RHIMP|nr:hypothetical protein HPB51_007829 [Rhipicephalus microplus]